MEAREENFRKIRRTGEILIAEEHFASAEVTSRLQTLDEEHKQLWDTWNTRQHLFQQSKELQVSFWLFEKHVSNDPSIDIPTECRTERGMDGYTRSIPC